MYYNWKDKTNTEELKIVCNLIRNGELVIFPTETVYGIGANALDEAAVGKIFLAKGRPSDNPLIVHLADRRKIEDIAQNITEMEQILIDEFMPGPFTIILERKPIVPDIVTAGLDTVAVRIPENIIAKGIITFSGYKTPAIARLLIDDGIEPIYPYKRPQTKDGFFKKYEYIYDEYYDCYICPNDKILKYSTTNRDGYREYKSCAQDCQNCPYLHKCTGSKNHVKVVTRHIWEEYMERCEDIRQTIGNKEIYEKRKETIERLFGTAKEHHGFRYTQLIGKARMEMKVGLTFACLNLKKLAKILDMRERNSSISLSFRRIFSVLNHFFSNASKKVGCFA